MIHFYTMEGRGWSGVPNVVQKELAPEGFKEDCEKIVDRLQKVFKVPSRECDPSDELREILEDASGEIREEMITSLEELITIASKIAPEYVRATYGDEERRIPPSELYEKNRRRTLQDTEKSREIAKLFLDEWFEEAEGA